jgi:hypothetical protein
LGGQPLSRQVALRMVAARAVVHATHAPCQPSHKACILAQPRLSQATASSHATSASGTFVLGQHWVPGAKSPTRTLTTTSLLALVKGKLCDMLAMLLCARAHYLQWERRATMWKQLMSTTGGRDARQGVMTTLKW